MDTTLPDAHPARNLNLPAETLQVLSQRYELLGEVGRGGMGAVLRARQRTLDRLVAIKIMLPGAPVDRFLREARLLAQIRSPYVVTIYDCEVLPDGSPMLVMEWIDGTNLLEELQRRTQPLSEDEVIPIMREAAEGMLAAAELGIIHRDVKPSNILLDKLMHAHVADFGLARGTEGHADLTLPGTAMMGTPYYMAPEQAENPRGVDTRADIYSFGATFYHVLTGVTPFDGETIFSILFRHKTEPLIPPRTRNPRLSIHLSEFLERCLAKSPNDRFASFGEVIRQLDQLGRASPWEDWSDETLTSYWGRYQSRRDLYLNRRQELLEPDVYEFPGGRVLQILTGNMVEQEVDALVSSEDGYLTMGETVSRPAGVAAALREAAGPDYVARVRSFRPVRPGRVLVTEAGALPARFVFHGITLEGAVDHRVCPSRDLISEILAACFYHADSLYVRRMALPLLGTGTGGFSQEVCLDTMFRFLSRMLLRGLTTVREVRIVLFHRAGDKPARDLPPLQPMVQDTTIPQ